MICNVGGIERPIRIALGILLIGIGALAGLSTVGMGIVLAGGAIVLLTGAIGFCPLTALLGINTCAAKPGTKK
ncbi:MAG: DUF2892 domain-containing protein [Nitrospira sp.]|nr:DUF2892 domain-containing protein [Nitrospira sp.]MBH0185289.1 DUF2892 domain-containing protein [Nitrospira sp.]